MKILFLHQNFPGQYKHLAPALVARGHQVLALTAERNSQRTSIRTYRYPDPGPAPDAREARLGTTYATMTDRALRVAKAAAQLRDQVGFTPDLIIAHPGWGETLFLREVWPAARQLVYAEFYYGSQGLDVGFDPEFSRPDLHHNCAVVARQAHMAHALVQADAAMAPTEWQADTYPACLRDKITIIHDGIDTDHLCPDPQATFQLPNGQVLRPGDEVLTYVARNIEPYRGSHIFFRALPDILAARPQAQVVIIGRDGTSYGPSPREGTWKEQFWREIAPRVDASRVHFVGALAYGDYLNALRVGRVHAYLTVPFVLSWSLIEAMSLGCAIVASRTGPVAEVISDTETGRLVDFFDVAGWSEAIIDALETPQLYAQIRANARARAVQDYDLRRVCLPRQLRLVEGM